MSKISQASQSVRVVEASMKVSRFVAAFAVLWLVTARSSRAQTEPTHTLAVAPPKLLLLVHQTFQPGKASARQKLAVAISRACEQLAVPNSWIDLESITGPSEAISFDPFDSFEEIDNAGVAWAKIFAAPTELTRLQEELRVLVASERTVIAVRRDDVGYRANSIDLSKARTVRMLEVQLHPGRENDFVEALRVLGAAYEKINSDTPWVVYQVNAGMASPAFLIFVPMKALRQNDDLLARRKSLQEAEGETGVERMQQIARESYAATESNIYAVSPEMSHVSREFAAGDPEFWSPARPVHKEATGKKGAPKPST